MWLHVSDYCLFGNETSITQSIAFAGEHDATANGGSPR
jgi:hypothetical protein